EPEAGRLLAQVREAGARDIEAVADTWDPDQRNYPPRRLAERLEEVAEQRRRLAALVVAWAVHLVQVELFGEAAPPDLREQRTAEVEKLVRLVVGRDVGVLAQILLGGHARPGMHIGAVGAVGPIGSPIAVPL